MTDVAVELVEADAADAALLKPFDEQTGFDVAAGVRTLFRLRLLEPPLKTQAGTDAGSAVLGRGQLDLHIEPEFRARGAGHAAVEQLVVRAGDGPLTAWSHENHPAARALAARFGFEATRTLLQLRLDDLNGLEAPPAGATQPASGARIDEFRPGIDDAEWLALNARVFSFHPEQGRVTQNDLDERMHAPWFRADDFLVAHDEAGRMVGYNWLKVEPATPGTGTGEIYVIGVAPEASARGLGRSLMVAGLARLRERGCDAAELYVEGDNAPAVRLYRSLGFVDAAVHVQYSRSFTGS